MLRSGKSWSTYSYHLFNKSTMQSAAERPPPTTTTDWKVVRDLEDEREKVGKRGEKERERT